MNNRAPKDRIRVGMRQFILFKCKFPFCCNFITTPNDQNMKYCRSHKSHQIGKTNSKRYKLQKITINNFEIQFAMHIKRI